jgi:hypothetical protein
MISTERWKDVMQTGLMFRQYLQQWPEAIKNSNGKYKGEFYSINYSRTRRWEKTRPWESSEMWPPEKTEPLNEHWIVLTEYWCGDSAHNLSPLNAFVEACGINPVYIFRDKNPDIMDAFLTNGSRSIPKLIRLDKDTFEIKGLWGPRSSDGQEYFEKLKSDNINPQQRSEEMQRWYNLNRGLAVIADLQVSLFGK